MHFSAAGGGTNHPFLIFKTKKVYIDCVGSGFIQTNSTEMYFASYVYILSLTLKPIEYG